MGQLLCGELILGQMDIIAGELTNPIWSIQCRNTDKWQPIDRQLSDIKRCNTGAE